MENYVSERSLELQEMALIRIKQLQSEVDAMITEAGGDPGGQIKDFKLLSKEKLLEAAAKLQEVDDLFIKFCPIQSIVKEVQETTHCIQDMVDLITESDIAVQGEIEQLSELIQKMKASGKTDTEILDELESVMKHIIEYCKTGWR